MTRLRMMSWAAAGIALLSFGVTACSNDAGGESGSGSTVSADANGSTAKPGTPKTSLKVAFVYVGPIGDAGWTKRHDDGRLYLTDELTKKLGKDNVTVKFTESILEDPKVAEPLFEKLCAERFDLVFATSFGYGDSIEKVAPKCRGTIFMHASGYKTQENVGTYFGAAEEARYLSGIAAARASKTGKLGYVAAFGIPEVVRGINAFTLGAQSVNPDATVTVAWTSTWFDPDKEGAAANTLLDGGADVITQHQDTPAPGEAATARGAKWVGYNDDMSRFAPDAWLTAPEWDWGAYYLSVAESVLDGSWKSSQYYGDMRDGLVKLAPFGTSVDQATKDEIAKATDAIKKGTLKPFTGPIVDQAGKVRVPEGKTATLDELLSMDYLVKGVIGEIPKS